MPGFLSCRWGNLLYPFSNAWTNRAIGTLTFVHRTAWLALSTTTTARWRVVALSANPIANANTSRILRPIKLTDAIVLAIIGTRRARAAQMLAQSSIPFDRAITNGHTANNLTCATVQTHIIRAWLNVVAFSIWTPIWNFAAFAFVVRWAFTRIFIRTNASVLAIVETRIGLTD